MYDFLYQGWGELKFCEMGSFGHRLYHSQWGIFFQECAAKIFQAQQLFFLREAGTQFPIQLNMYNFHKIRENSAESYFHHECFDRNNRSALADIQRKP